MKKANNILLKILSLMLMMAAGISCQRTESKIVIESPIATGEYIVLEPETWVGKKLPIIDYIDIGEQLKTGNWLVLFYHHECPDCQVALTELAQMAMELKDYEDFLRFTVIEVPPFGPVLPQGSLFYAQLPATKEWFIATPAMVLLKDSKVTQAWEQKLPNWGCVLDNIYAETKEKSLLQKGGDCYGLLNR